MNKFLNNQVQLHVNEILGLFCRATHGHVFFGTHFAGIAILVDPVEISFLPIIMIGLADIEAIFHGIALKN